MKILLTHDGSVMADVAVPRVRALALAAGPQTSVVALCIVPAHATPGSSEANEATRSLERIRRALSEQVHDVTAQVLAGTAGPLILETAGKLNCDLIAMSTSGMSGEKQFLGSVADYVARQSQHTPVMLCRPEPAHRQLFKKILLPLDGSDLNASAIEEAQRLASTTGAGIVLLRLVDTVEQLRSMTTPAGYSLGVALPREDSLIEAIEAERADAQRELDADATRLRGAGLGDVTAVVRPGQPGETIVATAEELDCDVIVMSTAGRGRREGTRILGSVAGHVLQHVAHAAVLLVPPRT